AALGLRAVAPQLRPVAGVVAPAGENRLDGAMDEEVRVAPDRRSEVRVVLVGEPEVADVLRTVLRLLQRAQQHRLEQLHVRTLAHGLEQLRVVLRGGFVPALEREAESLEKLAQAFQLLRGRAFVDAVQRRMLALGENVRGANVRGEHALLDDAVGIVALDLLDARRAPLAVEAELGFGRLEIHGAALLPRLEQRSEESIQQLQTRQQSLEFQRRLAPRVTKRRGHRGIGEPRARAHDRRIEAIRTDLALHADHHVAGHAQAVDFGVEGAQAVG